jgi:hypothetical protein
MQRMTMMLAVLTVGGCYIGDYGGSGGDPDSFCWMEDDGVEVCEDQWEGGDGDEWDNWDDNTDWEDDDGDADSPDDDELPDACDDPEATEAVWLDPGTVSSGHITVAHIHTDGSILFDDSLKLHIYGDVEVVGGEILNSMEVLVVLDCPADAELGPVDVVLEHADGSIDLASNLIEIVDGEETMPPEDDCDE